MANRKRRAKAMTMSCQQWPLLLFSMDTITIAGIATERISPPVFPSPPFGRVQLGATTRSARERVTKVRLPLPLVPYPGRTSPSETMAPSYGDSPEVSNIE